MLCTRTGADHAQGVNAVGQLHLGSQGGINGGDDQANGIQHRSSHELGERGGRIVNVVHRFPLLYVGWLDVVPIGLL